MRVYIAGPYTLGDVVLNVRAAISASDQLLRAGHTPFCPHLSHFWHLLYPHVYETWLHYTMEWLKVCGAVIRLKGESSGADVEVAWAQAKSIPVFTSVDAFIKWHKDKFPVDNSPLSLTRHLDANSTGTREPTSQDNASRGSTSKDGTPRG